jgi:hypothetical protein
MKTPFYKRKYGLLSLKNQSTTPWRQSRVIANNYNKVLNMVKRQSVLRIAWDRNLGESHGKEVDG